jgi:protein-L-isoaspartate O-methyltransferase
MAFMNFAAYKKKNSMQTKTATKRKLVNSKFHFLGSILVSIHKVLPVRKRTGLGAWDVKEIEPEITYNNNRVGKDGKKQPDGIEIRFPQSVPTADVREQLKEFGFKFSPKQEMWYAYDSPELRRKITAVLEKHKITAYDVKDVEQAKNEQVENGRHYFWAKIVNLNKVPNTAAIKVHGTIYSNKDQAASAMGKINFLRAIDDNSAYFKKFFTVKNNVVNIVSQNKTPEPQNNSTSPAAVPKHAKNNSVITSSASKKAKSTNNSKWDKWHYIRNQKDLNNMPENVFVQCWEFEGRVKRTWHFDSKSALINSYPKGNIDDCFNYTRYQFYNAVDAQNAQVKAAGKKLQRTGNGSRKDLEIAIKLRNIAYGMEKRVRHLIDPPIGRQRPTRRRQHIAAGMRQTGYALEKQQLYFYALAFAWDTGLIHSKYRILKDLRKTSEIGLVDDFYNLKNRKQPGYKYDELIKAGIKNETEWEKAHKSLQELVMEWQKNGAPRTFTNSLNPVHTPVVVNRALEEEIKAMEAKLLGRKIPGFFPTPPDLIDRMIDLAMLREGDSVLEPSFGKGDILEAICRSKQITLNLDVTGIEQNFELYSLVQKKRELLNWKCSLINGDFLTIKSNGKNINKIIMNPPFEKGVDIDHVMHAYNEFLAPGGKLVALMGAGSFQRSYKKEKEFQNWIKEKIDKGEAGITLLKNQFNTPNSFIQTGVMVYLVSIGKPKIASAPNTTNQNSNMVNIAEMEANAELEFIALELELLKFN